MEPEDAPLALNGSAHTDLFNSTDWQLVHAIIPPYIFLICLLGILGNSFVLLVFLLQRGRWSVPEIYLGNLALADMVLLAFLPFWAMNIVNFFAWRYGELMCKLVNLSIRVNMYSSVYMLVMVNVDRYLALVLTMRARWLRRGRYARLVCASLWLFGLGMGAPLAAFQTLQEMPGVGAVECVLLYPNYAWRAFNLLQLLLVGFAVPFPIICFCSLNILLALRRRRAEREGEGPRGDRKATLLVGGVTLLFLLCWGPFHVTTLLELLCDHRLLDEERWARFLNIATQFSVYLAFSNSCLNPLLYVCSGNFFRRKVSSIVQRRRRSSPDATLQPTLLTSLANANQVKP